MPDSSIVLSKRNKPFFQTSQVIVFVTIFLILAVAGIFSYNYFLKTNVVQIPKIKDQDKTKQIAKVDVIEPISLKSTLKPKDVFVGLGTFTNTGFTSTATSPINLFTGNQVLEEKKNNLKLRPWAVLISNKPEDRPQISVSEADIVYEAVNELGTTNLLGIFYENRPVEIGPIGDLKYYFASFALEYSPFLIFNSAKQGTVDKPNLVDPVVDVYKFIGSYGLYSISKDKTDEMIFSKVVNGNSTQSILDIGKLYGYLGKVYGSYLWVDSDNFNAWGFKEDLPKVGIKEFSFNFWDLADYEVKWVYNSGQNNYLRYQGGLAFIDKKNGEQVKTKNIILLFSKETQVTDAYNNLNYELVGKGDAYFYLDGELIEGAWEKLSFTSKTKFYDKNSNEIKFNKGNTWVEILPTSSKSKVVNIKI